MIGLRKRLQTVRTTLLMVLTDSQQRAHLPVATMATIVVAELRALRVEVRSLRAENAALRKAAKVEAA